MIPVLIIAFRRRDLVRKQAQSLLETGVNQIYVSIDGPRTTKDLAVQKLLIQDLRLLSEMHRGAIINIRRGKQNLGVGIGVLSAIDWFFSQVLFGIILEDDLIFHHSFLQYFEKSREVIESDSVMMMASGSNFFPDKDRLNLNYIHYPMIWGWATTQNKWYKLKERMLVDIFDSPPYFKDASQKFFWSGAQRVLRNQIDTWDLPLAYSFHKNRFKCLLPSENLISNIGDDTFSTHTRNTGFPMKFPLAWEGYVTPDPEPASGYIDRCLDIQFENQVFKVRKRNHITFLKSIVEKGDKEKRNFVERVKGIEFDDSEMVTFSAF